MKAIILAAGVGRRISAAHRGPKCLLQFGGRTLLDRHLDTLATIGVCDVTLCLGHDDAAVRGALAARGGRTPLVHFNPLYRLGSIVSLWCVRHTLLSGDDVLLMDGDVLYHPRILARLASSPQPNCFLLDREFEPGDEPVKICLEDGRVVEFRKRIEPGLRYNRVGESVGFFKLDPGAAARVAVLAAAYVADGRRDEPHEEALRDLALSAECAVGVEDVTGLPWIEIDFPEDVERATQDVLPRIDDIATA